MVLNMAKKPLNKFVLLPLFLGLTCLISAGLIAGVNSFTEPVINQNVIDQKNAGYYKVLGISSADEPVDKYVDELASKNITGKKQFFSGSTLIGFVYDVKVKGYGGDIIYQVGFKDGNFSGINVISHSETSTFGGLILTENGKIIDERIKNKSVESDVFALLNTNGSGVNDSMTAGKTITTNALVKSLNNCVADYMAEVA